MLFGIQENARLFLYSGAADMRKGFDGLSGFVINHLGLAPLSGDIFIFINAPQLSSRSWFGIRPALPSGTRGSKKGTFELPAVVARRAAKFYSFFGTCKTINVNPYK